MSSGISVIKLGGSLLQLPDVAERLVTLLHHCAISKPLVIVGGGETADLVRTWEPRFDLSLTACHDLAVESMSLNARLLTTLCDQACLAADLDAVQSAWSSELLPVLDSAEALRRAEKALPTADPECSRLPRTWDVTSDSIAAWFARFWQADELVLLKSVSSEGRSIADLVSQKVLDPHFQSLATAIPSIAWCNLRESGGFQKITIPNQCSSLSGS